MGADGTYSFRGRYRRVALGTASDRYAGWLGQIYDRERWEPQVASRAKTLGRARYTERVLPVASVEEYFAHFELLELDFPYYAPLLSPEGAPSRTHHALAAYAAHLKPGDRVFVKAPQAFISRRLPRGAASFAANPEYLNAEACERRFLAPARALLGEHLAGVIFEQEYQRARDREESAALAGEFSRFFAELPPGADYHVELRTAAFLGGPVRRALAARGVGTVLSHWTWLPTLAEQCARTENPASAAGEAVIRLMTPRNVRYADAYARAFPFDAMVEGMMDSRMLPDVAAIAAKLAGQGTRVNVIINNRAGGNAPWIAAHLADLLDPVLA